MDNRLAGHRFYNKTIFPVHGVSTLQFADRNRSDRHFGKHKCLPILGRAQGGEEGNMILEENPIDWTFRPTDLQGVQSAFAVYVTGNSMVPKYGEHDIAYIHPTLPPRIGRFVLVETTENEGFIKQFLGWRKDQLVLKQYNPEKTLTFHRNQIKTVMLVIGSMDA